MWNSKRALLKFYTKYLIHTLKDPIFIQGWNWAHKGMKSYVFLNIHHGVSSSSSPGSYVAKNEFIFLWIWSLVAYHGLSVLAWRRPSSIDCFLYFGHCLRPLILVSLTPILSSVLACSSRTFIVISRTSLTAYNNHGLTQLVSHPLLIAYINLSLIHWRWHFFPGCLPLSRPNTLV